jgi:putative flippase GtrA
MNLLSHWAQLPLVLAGTISFICAVLNNFTWNRIWTYPESRSRP